jgi:hypothetical protein
MPILNLDEARKVTWIKTNPCPMGELLDSGYLTKSRLEWTVQKAYNPKLREAAQVLLASFDSASAHKDEPTSPVPVPAFQVGLPLEKARSTPWPFSPFRNQSMGMLVETKQLSTKDLGYAIDNARDEKVKQAAITLMLVRLDQAVKEPPPSAGYAKVTSAGRSYAQRTETRLTLIQGMFLGCFMNLVLALFMWWISTFIQPHPETPSVFEVVSTPAGMIALAVFVVAAILAVGLTNYLPDLILRRIDKKIREQRLGQEGEDQVVQLMSQVLDGNWHIFRNVSIPGRYKGDLDVVLAGPSGVWVLEVKNFSGMYKNVGDAWKYRRGGQWKNASVNPSRQAKSGSLRLKNFLTADRINIYVNPVVVWANPESPLAVENPSVAVWQFDHLADELGNIWEGEKLSRAEREKIINKLTRLCESQKQEMSR